MEQVTVKDKSFQLVIRVVRLYKHLVETKKKYVLSKQLLRSGTSIGANVSESQSGESKADFIHKLAIAQKETKETIYWLELLHATEFLTESEFKSIHEDSIEVLKMLTSILKTSKNNLKL